FISRIYGGRPVIRHSRRQSAQNPRGPGIAPVQMVELMARREFGCAWDALILLPPTTRFQPLSQGVLLVRGDFSDSARAPASFVSILDLHDRDPSFARRWPVERASSLPITDSKSPMIRAFRAARLR